MCPNLFVECLNFSSAEVMIFCMKNTFPVIKLTSENETLLQAEKYMNLEDIDNLT